MLGVCLTRAIRQLPSLENVFVGVRLLQGHVVADLAILATRVGARLAASRKLPLYSFDGLLRRSRSRRITRTSIPGFPVRSGHHHCGKLRADTTDVEDLICVGEHVRRTSSDVRPKLGSSLRKPAPMRSLKVDEHLLLVLRVQDVDVEG